MANTPVDPNSTLGLLNYYLNLLIIQYKTKPKAVGTIAFSCSPALLPQTSTQDIFFSGVAASGTFLLQYNGNDTPTINWNDSTATIQTKLQTVPGLGSVTVTGSIASQKITVTFTGVNPPALMLNVASNSLETSGAVFIDLTIVETDVILPLAIQDGFNIIGPNIAVGKQLDILGKYVGVIRQGSGAFGSITLNDQDFIALIKFAIIQNNSGSSLSDIETNLNQFFPGQFIVTDYRDMHMSYLLSSSLGSQNLFILLVQEKLIPRPMAVGATVIIPPDLRQYFGFRTYDAPNPNVKPFNNYDTFNLNWYFLSYSDAIVV